MQKNAVLLFALLYFVLVNALPAQDYRPDSLYTGANGYIEYLPGSLPLIFAASHGGDLAPSTIPDRNCAGCVSTTDLNTQELARQIREALFKITGCYPHVVINRLRRSKLDANREINEAAQGNPEAEQAWKDFHFFLDAAKKQIENSSAERGLFIDIHGHGHDIQRLELGYLLSASTLRQGDAVLNSAEVLDNTSIRQLVSDNRQKQSHSQLIRGNLSLGSLLEKESFPSVPSMEDPAPRSGDPFFSGGYNTERHGSAAGGNIDAIQIECNYQGVRDAEFSREIFSSALSRALLEYLRQHYFEVLPGCPVTSLSNAEQWPVKLFPNPGCGVFQIEPRDEGSRENLQIEIFDASGRTRAIEPFSHSRIQLPPHQFPNGIYWMVLKKESRLFDKIALIQKCP